MLMYILNLQVTVPSLASVFNEYALKSQYDTSIYLQVIFFSFVAFCIPILCSQCISEISRNEATKGQSVQAA